MSYREKARGSLKSARILFEADCYDSCVSRCYYAMFQMAVAALAQLGIHPPREERYSHAWVHAAVARELIHRRKLLPAQLTRALPAALALRAEADYSEGALGKKRTARMLSNCQTFLTSIKQEVFRDGAN